jgi:hypothetical protein
VADVTGTKSVLLALEEDGGTAEEAVRGADVTDQRCDKEHCDKYRIAVDNIVENLPPSRG